MLPPLFFAINSLGAARPNQSANPNRCRIVLLSLVNSVRERRAAPEEARAAWWHLEHRMRYANKTAVFDQAAQR
jgi:hypothetical protein